VRDWKSLLLLNHENLASFSVNPNVQQVPT